MRRKRNETKRGTILLMVVGLLSMLFIIISAYLTLARFERQTSKQIRQGREIDDIIDTVNELVMQKMIEQWTDNNGNLLSDGQNPPDHMAYPDVPGFRGSGYQAALELVRDFVYTSGQDPTAYVLPASTTLSAYTKRAGSFEQTVFSSSASADTYWYVDDMMEIPDALRGTGQPYDDELERWARNPLMDADGDGIPDSRLSAQAIATELANAIAGVPVRVPIVENEIQNGSPASLRMRDTARYVAAVRVVPHGGMISLDSLSPQFLERMFELINKDGSSFPPRGFSTAEFIQQVRAEAATLEGPLRRRNMLATAAPLNGDLTQRDPNNARVSGLLRLLENTYPATYASAFTGRRTQGKDHDWQRVNMALEREWSPARDALFLDPTAFNAEFERFEFPPSGGGSAGFATLPFYDRRHLITSISNSDELARKQGPPPAPPSQPFGTRAGELKFYLGDFDQCYTVDPSTGVVRFDSFQAQPVLQRMMNLYYDMLAGYKDWKTVAGNPNEEAVSRQQQAAMLTVNTVAFAAPRTADQHADLPGFIDVVRFSPGSISPAPVYYGYGPQPFITQAIVYRDSSDERAVGVELYNPNEAFRVRSVNDEHALYLPQFAVSLNDEYDDPINGINPLALRPLDRALNPDMSGPDPSTPRRFPARRFMTLSISNGRNAFFENRADGGDIKDLAVQLNGSGKITIKLWRADFETARTHNAAGIWHLVDKFTVPDADPPQSGVGQWLSTYRDTRAEDYFGLDTSVPAVPTRWRMALGFRDTDPLYPTAKTGSGPPSGIAIMSTYGAVGPGDAPATVPFGPTTALYAMNAPIIDLNGRRISISVHGVARPPSFPTVGFMHFVPRFSHVKQTATDFEPMTAVLRDQWMGRNYSFTATQSPPADFGHMPIFDNEQKADGAGQFDNERAGRIPWGLLVYDYFTTLDPSTVDPYRVPGRININAAPWWVLASLPVVEPSTLFGEYGPMVTPPSPAFWSGAGILFGFGNESPGNVPPGIARYPAATPNRPSGRTLLGGVNPVGGWHLVGPQLAQAAVSYRDRIRYSRNNQFSEFWSSERRSPSFYAGNDRLAVVYRDQNIYGTIRRGPAGNDSRVNATNAWKYGFLSVGELINVKGFDSAIYDPATGVPVRIDPAIQLIQDEPPLSVVFTATAQPRAADFFKAVSLMAMLDSHFLTTRGNTFTVYVSVMDRENPQASVRSQITVDRSNLLPRLIPGRGTLQNHGMPAIIAQRQIAYSNTRFDD